ncbi:hypothetical protein Vadar_001650 [Vaccinium darrowii]|uniref:Uncharacterized protein n=1 Tax=Vaccinium darrowii TaxID=229202 RepID=A0ACB7Z102_9ERIC|nr:hypothetical protein Vadar_001650 [Vaccinium darrowii]
MVQLVELKKGNKRSKFCINDNMDILIEILKRLDGRSIATAACVCRLWLSIARSDRLWESLCFRHVSPPPPPGIRPVVEALGGYRRLYTACLRPVLSRLSRRKRLRSGGSGGGDAEVVRRVWRRHEVELSISLFCVDYYERLGGGGVGGRVGDGSASSLMFLCKHVNV